SRGYVWRNLALDVGHVLTYFVGHEAHHRGQIVMIARQTGHRLPNEVMGRLWWWKQKSTTETRRHGEKQKQFATDERSYAASTRAKRTTKDTKEQRIAVIPPSSPTSGSKHGNKAKIICADKR